MSGLTPASVTFYCLIAYAIHICNSQWSGSFVLQPVNLKYARCPSCSRDCPAVLSSPWYKLPATRDTRFVRSKESGYVPRVPSTQSNPPRQSRSPWYGNVNPYERYFGSRARNAVVNTQSVPTAWEADFEKTNCGRECPCNNRVSSPYPFTGALSPLQITRKLEGSSYYTKPHPWSRGTSYRSSTLQMDSGLNKDWIEFGPDSKSVSDTYFRRDVNSMFDGNVGVKQEPTREILVVDSAEEDQEEEEEGREEESEENPYSIYGGGSPLTEFLKWSKGPSVHGKYQGDISVKAPIQMAETPVDKISPERLDYLDEFDFPKLASPTEILYSPEVKYNPYNLSPDLNIRRMMKNLEMPLQNSMHEQDGKSLELRKRDNTNDMEANLETKEIAFVNNADVFLKVSKEETNSQDTSRQNINAGANTKEQITTNDGSMEEMTKRSSMMNKDILSFEPNPDFINDMENPSLLSTEPTPTDSFMETSTTM